MLIIENIELLINHKSKHIYKRFNPVLGEILLITTLDLPKGSRHKIKFNCDICDKICTTSFYSYNKIINSISPDPKLQNMCLCKKCCQLKGKQTMLNKYGVESYTSTDVYKNIIKEKYNVDNVSQLQKVKDKKKQKALDKYGVENVLQSDIIKDKIKITNLEKYGVINPTQNKEIFEKAQASAYKKIRYNDTDIFYQGSYELHFIDYCINNNIIFEKGLTIDYVLDFKNRKYHSDFYLPKYNLICEVKSTYTLKEDYLENMAKMEFTIKAGYNFLFIIDKKYDNLEKSIYGNIHGKIS
jgi:hypothetical protein